MGSFTPTEQITRRNVSLEINSPEGCMNSADKRRTKLLFQDHEIPQAEWFMASSFDELLEKLNETDWKHGCIAKRYNSSKGNGIFLIEDFSNIDGFKEFTGNNERELEKFIFEKYYTYTKEYRLHCDKWNGVFYACRKMLKADAEVRWHRHDDNSVWILEDNEAFMKPENWDEICSACVRALDALSLDIGAFDIKVSKNGDFIIMECNSAPGLGEIGLQKYEEEITNIVNANTI